MKATAIKRNAVPVNPPLKPCTCGTTTFTHTLTCERVATKAWYYQPRKLHPKEAMTFIGLITEAFSVEERDIISHWFAILTD